MTTTERADSGYVDPPSDLAAEAAVLGGMMAAPQVIVDVADQLSADTFYRPQHGHIYQAITELDTAGDPTDPVAVANRLERDGHGGQAGYLLQLYETPTAATSATYYASIVAETARRRRAAEVGRRITQQAETLGIDADTVLERATAELQTIQDARPSRGVFDAAELAPAALARLDEPIPPGLPTGFADLDDLLGSGLKPGTLTIVGARPSVGKSVIVANIAGHAASRGVRSLLLSLEMDREEIMFRLLASEASVELSHLTRHQPSDDDRLRLAEAAARIASWPLTVDDDTAGIGMAGITGRARRQARRGDFGLVAVDYLQLVGVTDNKDRHVQVGALSRGLKLLARNLGVPVIVAAQLNRGPESRSDKRPYMSDLRESGSLEADADNVWLLHDPPDEGRGGELDVIVDKNRQGRGKRTVTLAWCPHYGCARDLARPLDRQEELS